MLLGIAGGKAGKAAAAGETYRAPAPEGRPSGRERRLDAEGASRAALGAAGIGRGAYGREHPHERLDPAELEDAVLDVGLRGEVPQRARRVVLRDGAALADEPDQGRDAVLLRDVCVLL